MTIRKKFLILLLLFLVTQYKDFSNSTWAQSYSHLKLDAGRVPWTRLSYQAKTFWVEVITQIRLESMSATEVEASLLSSPRGVPLKASSPKSYKIDLEMFVDSIFHSPIKVVNQVWFNPHDATALGRIRLKRGEDDFKKVYRFTKQGVFRHRREPKDQQETPQNPENWTDVKDTFYSYNLAKLGCPNVSERLVLVYIVSAAEILKSDKPLTLCIFGKRQLHHARLRPLGLQSLKIDFVEKKQQATIRRQGKIDAFKIALETQPLESDLEEMEKFSFLGFHEDIVIFIDPVSKLPIQVSGKIPKVGNSTLKLKEVQLR